MTIVAHQPDSALELWDELSEEIWQVQQGAAEARLMSLGEMDAAMQRGDIDATALVCRVGSNDWRSLASIAGIAANISVFQSFAGALPAHPTAAVVTAADDSDSLLPVASSIDVTDAPDVDVQRDFDFDLAASPVPAMLFVPDAFASGTMRYAGSARSTPRRSAGFANYALGLAALVTTFGVVFVSVSTFLANTYGGGKADAAFVVTTRAPQLSPVAFEMPEPRLAEPRAAVPCTDLPAPVVVAATPAPAIVVEEKSAVVPAPVKPAPRPVFVAAAVSQKTAGVAISSSERAWDSRRVVHKH